MNIRPIRNRRDYEAALKRIEALMVAGEILNRKRGLSLAMIRRLNAGLGIPLEVLVGTDVEQLAY